MDSLRSRALAFALPTLGILLSGTVANAGEDRESELAFIQDSNSKSQVSSYPETGYPAPFDMEAMRKAQDASQLQIVKIDATPTRSSAGVALESKIRSQAVQTKQPAARQTPIARVARRSTAKDSSVKTGSVKSGSVKTGHASERPVVQRSATKTAAKAKAKSVSKSPQGGSFVSLPDTVPQAPVLRAPAVRAPVLQAPALPARVVQVEEEQIQPLVTQSPNQTPAFYIAHKQNANASGRVSATKSSDGPGLVDQIIDRLSSDAGNVTSQTEPRPFYVAEAKSKQTGTRDVVIADRPAEQLFADPPVLTKPLNQRGSTFKAQPKPLVTTDRQVPPPFSREMTPQLPTVPAPVKKKATNPLEHTRPTETSQLNARNKKSRKPATSMATEPKLARNTNKVDAQPRLPLAMQATENDRIQAEECLQEGFNLIQRRAYFSARARFVQTMRLVARSLDEQANSTRHEAALKRGLRAYKEAGEFFPSATRADESVNLYAVVGGHSTPVAQDLPRDELSARRCLREYMLYAEKQFSLALGQETLASRALYGLGRMESNAETSTSHSDQVRAKRSMAMFRSALLVDSTNYAAANELGVLLAKFGHYQEAIVSLQHCVKLSPESAAWTNLAAIHNKLGDRQHAELAMREAAATKQKTPAIPFVAAQPRIDWIDAGDFASMPQYAGGTQYAKPPESSNAAAPQPAEQPVRTATRKSWNPFSRKK